MGAAGNTPGQVSAIGPIFAVSLADLAERGDPADKAVRLARAARHGVAVPPAFVVTGDLLGSSAQTIRKALEGPLEALASASDSPDPTARFLGPRPLLVAVRPSRTRRTPAPAAVLNLGLDRDRVEDLAKATGDRRFALDCYRRFWISYGRAVLRVGAGTGSASDPFSVLSGDVLRRAHVELDTELDEKTLERLIGELERLVERSARGSAGNDPFAQLALSLKSLAAADPGAPPLVMAMVYGNKRSSSGAGLARLRDPQTGERRLAIEFAPGTQGEEALAGIRSPRPESGLDRFPEHTKRLSAIAEALEPELAAPAELEFVVDEGRLFVVGVKDHRLSPLGELRATVELYDSGKVSAEAALRRLDPDAIETLIRPGTSSREGRVVLGKGLPASPGIASGRLAFADSTASAAWRERGDPVILVGVETAREDVHDIQLARGVVTIRGGLTSHAAVVCRSLGKPCLVGASELVIDRAHRRLSARGQTVEEGETLTIDGQSGELLLGERGLELAGEPYFSRLMRVADERRRTQIYAAVETLEDVALAKRLGAQGFIVTGVEKILEADPARVSVLLAAEPAGRTLLLGDFEKDLIGRYKAIIEAVEGAPLAFWLLDGRRVDKLPPELLLEPDVLRAQLDALKIALGEPGRPRPPAGLIAPRVSTAAELARIADLLAAPVSVLSERPRTIEKIRLGAAIETPRAVAVAGALAKIADFFVLSVRELSEAVFGFGAADLRSIPRREALGILEVDPLRRLDAEGAGVMLALAVERGRAARPDLEIGVFGDHAADPSSAEFFDRLSVPWVSCAARRLAAARLVAGRAVRGGASAQRF